MKRKLLSIFLAFAMSVSLLTVGASAVEPTYGDIAGHWAEASIERWSGHGIIQGNNGKFNPNGQLTCAHFAAILARLLKLPAAENAGFADNTPDAWHYDAINRCAAAGILKGNLNGTVTPNAPITRERAMVMLGRALGIEPIENPDLTKYTDAAQVASYAQGMLAALIEAGVVGGVTADQLAPQNNITRAATVTILDRAIGTYADKAGETINADGKGIVLVVADDVTVTGSVDKLLVPTNDIEVTVKGSENIDDITVSGDNSKVILDNASADNVTLDGEKSAVEAKNGAKIDNVIMSENAPGANVNAGNGTTIKNVENHAEDTSVTGNGTVKKVESNQDITVQTKDTNVKNSGDSKITVTDKNGNELTLKDKGNGKYTFTMPAGKVEVKATFMEDNSMLNFFYDVPNNAYFYEAVKWAVKNGITDGVGNNLFAPEQPCTRAQIVTFLWRAAGSPEPKGTAAGMTDVVSGSYYEKAVAWAIENGITTGTTTSTFSPDATCTRAQAVTFLARALKAKAASAAEFSDVPTGSYFADAVAWAAANGVTEGIGGGLFGSDNDCTRGQIVTFLYRAYNK